MVNNTVHLYSLLLQLHITMTVLELKHRLQTEHGYPADRMDILYKDRPMENTRYLFEYGVAHSSTLFVLLMLKFDILVHVETFWGKQYHLFVDSCTTGFGIIASILRRTVSQNAVDIVRLYELFLPKHTLVLFFGSQVVDFDHCLGFYKIESGSVLKLSTIGLAHEMDIRKVPIVLDSGKIQTLLASKFDRWSTVVLKLHGMTGYPVNLMKLLRNGKFVIDFSDTIGSVSKHRDTVELDVSAIKKDDDLLYGIPLKFKIARGITELLKVAPSRTIKSVKDTLERIGVPNASMHDLVVEGYRLPNDKRVVDVIEEYKVPIDLSLKQYPVFIHGHQNVIYKMLAYRKETLATFLMRVNMKTGLSFKDFLLLVCGNVLDDDESLPVFDTRISIRSSVFLIPRRQYRSFFVLHDDWMTKVRIPAYPKLQQIKDILWKERKVPEGGLASIGNFLQWYFGAHYNDSSIDKQTPLKERMMVYEANVGNRYLQMKVEQSKPRRNRPKASKNQEVSQIGLEKLNLKSDMKQRALSLPPNRSTEKLKLPHISRHMSADVNRKGAQNRYRKRKAYTTIPVPKPRQTHRDRQKRNATEFLPPPKYEYTYTDKQRWGEGAEPDNGEIIFCLRHDYSINTKKGRRRNNYE